MYILIYSIPDVLINSYLITALVPLKKTKTMEVLSHYVSPTPSNIV